MRWASPGFEDKQHDRLTAVALPLFGNAEVFFGAAGTAAQDGGCCVKGGACRGERSGGGDRAVCGASGSPQLAGWGHADRQDADQRHEELHSETVEPRCSLQQPRKRRP
jgi:hypothetical protein